MFEAGTVLWYSELDHNGIIKDDQGNEHYFDRSVISPIYEPKWQDRVVFTPHRLTGTLCARNVICIKEAK